MQLEHVQNVRVILDSFLHDLCMIIECLLPSGNYFCKDTETIARGSPWKNWAISSLLELEVSPLWDRHRRRLCPISCCRDWLAGVVCTCAQLRHLDLIGDRCANHVPCTSRGGSDHVDGGRCCRRRCRPQKRSASAFSR